MFYYVFSNGSKLILALSMLPCQYSEPCSCFIIFQSNTMSTCLRKQNCQTLLIVVLVQQYMFDQFDDKCFWDAYGIFCFS
jgi:hypothetical protein